MEKYQSMLSFFSSFLTVAAVAGFTGVMAEQLTGGKKAGISGKLRYLCALAVVASLAAPLPGFLASLKSALSAPLDLTDRLSAYGNSGDALGGRSSPPLPRRPSKKISGTSCAPVSLLPKRISSSFFR